eukprot:8281099-Alexandrium_andersonii.AAC.1
MRALLDDQGLELGHDRIIAGGDVASQVPNIAAEPPHRVAVPERHGALLHRRGWAASGEPVEVAV